MHFQEVFCRYLWNGPSTLKIEEEKNIFKTIIPSNFPVEHWLWDTTLQIFFEIWPGSKNSHLLFNYSIKNHHIFKNGRTSAFIIYGGSPQKFYSTVAITHLSQGSPWPFAYCDVNAFWAFFFTFLNCCAFFVSTGPHVGHLWKNLTLGFSPKLLGGVPIHVWKPGKNFGPKSQC